VATPGFKRSAAVHAKAYGLPEYRPAILDLDDRSSIAGCNADRVEQFAEQMFDDAISILTGK